MTTPIIHDPTFMQAIINNPNDDGLRLVYADWLEEHGYAERADFIRFQIATHGLSERDAKYHEITKRYPKNVVLRSDFGSEELPTLGKGISFGKYQRGFAESVVVEGEVNISECEDVILKSIPFRGLEFRSCRNISVFKETRLLERTQHLGLLHYMDDVGDDPTYDHVLNTTLSELAAWVKPEQIESLSLTFTRLNEIAQSLSKNWHLTSLKKLVIFELRSENWRFETMINPVWLSSLSSCRICDCWATESADIEFLATHLNPKTLKRLSLVECGLSDNGLRSLIQAGLLSNLEFLELDANQFTDEVILELLEAIPQTAYVSLQGNNFTTKGMSMLATSPIIQRMTHLPSWRPLTAEHFFQLSQSPYAQNLTNLSIEVTKGEQIDWDVALNSKILKNLQTLQIKGTGREILSLPSIQSESLVGLYFSLIQIDSASQFVQNSFLPNLHNLSFRSCILDLDSIGQISNSNSFVKLSSLEFNGTNLDDKCVLELFQGTTICSLTKIELLHTQITDLALKVLPTTPLFQKLKKINLFSESLNPQRITAPVYFEFEKQGQKTGCQIDSWYVVDGKTKRSYSEGVIRLKTIPRLEQDQTFSIEGRSRLVDWLFYLWFQSFGTEFLVRFVNKLANKRYGYLHGEKVQTPLVFEANEVYSSNPNGRIKVIHSLCHSCFTESSSDEIFYRGPDTESFRKIDKKQAHSTIDWLLYWDNYLNQDCIECVRPRYTPEAGIDDCFAFPFHKIELLAPAVLRRMLLDELFGGEGVHYYVNQPAREDDPNRYCIIIDQDFAVIVRGDITPYPTAEEPTPYGDHIPF